VASEQRTLRVSIGPQPVLVVLVGLAGAILVFGLLTSAHRQFGWVLACAVVAAVIEPLVALLQRRLPRVLAILLAVLLVGAIVGGLVYGVLSDLDNQYARITSDAPRAAAELEQSERFGQLARDFRLQDRVVEVLAEVEKPTSGLGNEAASAAGTYFLCGVLTCFFLAWGPRAGQAALRQVADPARRRMLDAIADDAFTKGRTWVIVAIGRAVIVGGVTFLLCRSEDVPGPVVLAVVAAACTPIPGFGVLLGALPALLLEAGLGDGTGVTRMLVVFTLLQLMDLAFVRRVVTPRTLTVGPAVLVIAVIVGFEIYGLGGAVYGAALGVFLVAALDAAAKRDVTLADAVPELLDDEAEAAESPPAASRPAGA
jgi:predicted PurR-regulated permease PerM